jgi:hypothetical protein
VLRHIQDPLVPLRRLPGLARLDPDIDALVSRMLAKSRDDRPAKITEVAEKISEVLSLMAAPATQIAARPGSANVARAVPRVRKLSVVEADSDGLDPEQQSTVVARSNVDEPAPEGQREALLAARDGAEANRVETSQETLDIGEPTAPEIESQAIQVASVAIELPEEGVSFQGPTEVDAPEPADPALPEEAVSFQDEATEGTVRTHSGPVPDEPSLVIYWKPLVFLGIGFFLLGFIGAVAWWWGRHS